jgi:RNA polymerase sigma factor (sigma-70 family)
MTKRDRLYIRLSNRIRAFLLKNYNYLINDLNLEIDDIIQETILKYLLYSRYDKKKSAKITYILNISKNLIFHEYKKRTKKYKFPKYENIQDNFCEIQFKEEDIKLSDDIKNTKYFEYLIDFYLNNLSYKEIAEKYNINIGKVKNRICYCKKKIRKKNEIHR